MIAFKLVFALIGRLFISRTLVRQNCLDFVWGKSVRTHMISFDYECFWHHILIAWYVMFLIPEYLCWLCYWRSNVVNRSWLLEEHFELWTLLWCSHKQRCLRRNQTDVYIMYLSQRDCVMRPWVLYEHIEVAASVQYTPHAGCSNDGEFPGTSLPILPRRPERILRLERRLPHRKESSPQAKCFSL